MKPLNQETERELILGKAQDLGTMIQQTEDYRNFQQMEELFQSNTESRENLDQYNSLVQSIDTRQKKGELVEPWEFENLRQLADLVTSDPLAMDFIRARDGYMKLLESIQHELIDDSE